MSDFGADCEHDDELKTAFARLLARQLESLLMVLTAEQLASKGHSELPLLIQPSMAVAGYLLALLEATLPLAVALGVLGLDRLVAQGLRGSACGTQKAGHCNSGNYPSVAWAGDRNRAQPCSREQLLRSRPGLLVH